jgi:hypothetical protein
MAFHGRSQVLVLSNALHARRVGEICRAHCLANFVPEKTKSSMKQSQWLRIMPENQPQPIPVLFAEFSV